MSNRHSMFSTSSKIIADGQFLISIYLVPGLLLPGGGEALDSVPDVPHWPRGAGLLLHGLDVEGDGLVLALDSVGVHLHHLSIDSLCNTRLVMW